MRINSIFRLRIQIASFIFILHCEKYIKIPLSYYNSLLFPPGLFLVVISPPGGGIGGRTVLWCLTLLSNFARHVAKKREVVVIVD